MSRLVAFALFTALTGCGGLAVQADEIVPQTREEVRLSFAPIVQRTGPAVVNVYSERLVENRVVQFFEDLLNKQLGDEFGGVPRERVQNSLGSGVIVSPDGIIVTNHHVISGGTDIIVVLADKRSFAATVELDDEHSDLAVLKIDAKSEELPWLELGNSDDLAVGDLVLAIGNPFGVGQTVTSGIVSAMARTSVGITDYQFFIQTDAAINPGNSGGALIDVSGRLIGINTAIYSRSGGSHGIGFAIPSNLVRLVVQSALKGGKVQRPWLGAALQTLTPDIADSLGLDAPSGALVAKVHAKGPAARAGLRAGDVVVSVDGKPVQDPQGFQYRFITKGVGGSTELGVVRKGQQVKTTITLVGPIEDPPRDARDLPGRHPLAGCKVANLSPAVAQEIGMEDDTRDGVVVLEVAQRSAAARFGVKRGDIVVAINDEKITSVDQLVGILAVPTGAWRLAVERGGKVYSLAIQG
jgi:serine protease Do